MTRSFAMTAGVVLLLLPTGAVAEPTVRQTVDYINDTYKSCVPILLPEKRGRIDTSYSSIDIYDAVVIAVDKNRITMTESIRRIELMRTSSDTRATFCKKSFRNLPRYTMGAADISADSSKCAVSESKYTYKATALATDLTTEISLQGRSLGIECYSAKKCIQASRMGRIINWNGERDKLDWRGARSANYLSTCKNKGDKLRRAFIHLIKLLGGKKELF